MPRLTFRFELASTYFYLAAARIEALAASAKVDLIWRPFLLGPISQSQGWNTSLFNLFEAKAVNIWNARRQSTACPGLFGRKCFRKMASLRRASRRSAQINTEGQGSSAASILPNSARGG